MDHFIRILLVFIIHSIRIIACQEGVDNLRLTFVFQEELDSNYLLANLNDSVSILSMEYPLHFRFLLQPATHHDKLMITSSGEMYTSRVLDRDVICDRSEMECDLRVDVGIVDSTRAFQAVIVIIKLQDINDNVPTFPVRTFHMTLPENAPVGTELSLPATSDPDAGSNGDVEYEISENNGTFALKYVFLNLINIMCFVF